MYTIFAGSKENLVRSERYRYASMTQWSQNISELFTSIKNLCNGILFFFVMVYFVMVYLLILYIHDLVRNVLAISHKEYKIDNKIRKIIIHDEVEW